MCLHTPSSGGKGRCSQAWVPGERKDLGIQASGEKGGGDLREGLTQLQSYSWRRLAELLGRGWSPGRLRRFRPWEVPEPPRPAPPSAADPGSGGSH